jgi:hypothetical protein
LFQVAVVIADGSGGAKPTRTNHFRLNRNQHVLPS